MQVDLFFTGLMALVLKQPPDGEKRCNPLDAGGKVEVLMLAGGAGYCHRPRLVVDLEAVLPGSAAPDEVLPTPDPSGKGRQIAVWFLDHQSLAVDGLPPVDLTLGKRKREADAKKKNKWKEPKPGGINNTESHFSWIADLQEACPTGKSVKKDCIAKPWTCGGASSMSLSYKPGGAKLVPIWKNKSIYKFRDEYMQALADGFQITADLPKASIQLTPWAYPNPDCPAQKYGARTILLGRVPNQTRVRVWISDDPTEVPVETDKIPHFRHFYDLLEAPGQCPKPEMTSKATSQVVKCAICSSCNGQ